MDKLFFFFFVIKLIGKCAVNRRIRAHGRILEGTSVLYLKIECTKKLSVLNLSMFSNLDRAEIPCRDMFRKNLEHVPLTLSGMAEDLDDIGNTFNPATSTLLYQRRAKRNNFESNQP